MALAHSPQIVTDGLILYLDAANQRSYPGSGTVWTDLSGNGYNGTLVNGVTHDFSQGVLSINQTSSNQYIDIPINLSTTNHTIIASSRWTSSDGRGRVVTAKNNNWLLGYYGYSKYVDSYFAGNWVNLPPPGTQDTNWRIHTGTGNVSSDSWSIYSNGQLVGGPNTNGTYGPNVIRIGNSGIYTGEWSRCQVGFLMAYNRVLSADEIKQNFNALRGRYGI